MKRNRKPDNPGMIPWRYSTVVAAIVLLFGLLGMRTAYIQIIQPDRLRHEGDLRSLRTKSELTQRGIISDRHGEELAVSVPVRAIWADPKQVHESGSLDNKPAWTALAEVLQQDYQTLRERVSDPTKRFVYLKRQVSPAMGDYVEGLKLPGIYLKPESRRFYPAGEVSAHVVGFTDIDDRGQEGIELGYDNWLTGEPGKRQVRKDRLGQVIEQVGVLEQGKQANDLVLSIDQRLQAIAYRELKRAVAMNEAISGSLVMLDVSNGEILAMVNSPSYNPNDRGQLQGYRTRNRAVTDIFEPGSTVKPLVVLSALEHRVAEPGTVVDTGPGWMRIGGRQVRDAHNYGAIDLETILQKSSNVGVSKLALSVKSEALQDTFYRMGIGSLSGLGMVGETPGGIPQRRRWSDFELATLAFGYGVTTNALQLAEAYAILGSGGIRYPLSILKQDAPPLGERVIPERHARAVLKMLMAVTRDGGTAIKAAIPGYAVAGKTGTSRKAEAGGYGDDYVALFAGVAPASHPRLALVVVINEPKGDQYYGGDVAAPVFAEVMSNSLRLLNVAPDNMGESLRLVNLEGRKDVRS